MQIGPGLTSCVLSWQTRTGTHRDDFRTLADRDVQQIHLISALNICDMTQLISSPNIFLFVIKQRKSVRNNMRTININAITHFCYLIFFT